MAEQTVSIHDVKAVEVTGGPCLVRAFRCDRPLDSPARIPFGSASEVIVGRGNLDVSTNGPTITVGVPDDRMSTSHARFLREGTRVVVEDSGSKNGTAINGQPCTRAELSDGDVIETGHTFFVFRDRVPGGLGSEPTTFAPATDERAVPLVTLHAPLVRQFELLARVAATSLSFVVLGETGTGKEVVARAIHRLSKRSGAFVAINCGAIPPTLIESELFGVKKGAFSGANEDRPGVFRAADRGTLFLDEIGELPQPAQIALLRVLQEQEVVPIGGVKPVSIDVRIVTATHRPLEQLVETSAFRSDVFARLSGLTVRLPALRERREDLGLLIASLIHRIAPAPERVRFSRLAARALFTHPFRRNVRELEKALGLAIAITDGEIDLEHLPETLQEPLDPVAEPEEVDEPAADDETRKAQLIALLVQHEGKVAAVARDMGKARMQIHRWIQRYQIDLASYRKS